MSILISLLFGLFIGFKFGKAFYLMKEVRNAKFTTELVAKILSDEDIKLINFIDMKKKKREELEEKRQRKKELLEEIKLKQMLKDLDDDEEVM